MPSAIPFVFIPFRPSQPLTLNHYAATSRKLSDSPDSLVPSRSSCGIHLPTEKSPHRTTNTRLAEMEEKLRDIIDDRIENLVLPSGIPPTVEELQTIVKENFEIPYEFSLQYLDSVFQDYFTLHQSDQVKDKDTIKVVHTAPNDSNLLPLIECLDISDGQQSTDDDSASYAESSAGTSSSQDTIIGQSTTERRQPWPKQFLIPKFANETEMYLERATEDYKRNGTLMTSDLKVKKDILKKLAETIYTYAANPSAAQIGDVVEALLGKYPCLKQISFSCDWQQILMNKMANYRKKLRGPEDQKSAKNVKN